MAHRPPAAPDSLSLVPVSASAVYLRASKNIRVQPRHRGKGIMMTSISTENENLSETWGHWLGEFAWDHYCTLTFHYDTTTDRCEPPVSPFRTTSGTESPGGDHMVHDDSAGCWWGVTRPRAIRCNQCPSIRHCRPGMAKWENRRSEVRFTNVQRLITSPRKSLSRMRSTTSQRT